MADIQWVKPLTPDMIPSGCYAVWDYGTQEWTFPSLPQVQVLEKPLNIPTGYEAVIENGIWVINPIVPPVAQ